MAKTKEITKAQAITIAINEIENMDVDTFDIFTKDEVITKLSAIVDSFKSNGSGKTEENVAIAKKFVDCMEHDKAYTVAEFLAEFTERRVEDTGEKLVETFTLDIDGEEMTESKSKFGAIFRAGAGAGVFTESTVKGTKAYTVAE